MTDKPQPKRCPCCQRLIICVECLANNWCDRCANWTLGPEPEILTAFRQMCSSFSFTVDRRHGTVHNLVGG